MGGVAHGAVVVVVVGLGAATSCDGTPVIDSRHGGADSEAVGHIAVEVAHDAAVSIDACEAVSHGEGGGANAAEDGAAVTAAYHATVRTGIVGYSMDGDIAAYAAVLTHTSIISIHFNISRNAADTLPTSDASIGQDNILDGGTRSYAKEAHVVASIGGASLVDAYAADGMALAVEGAAEVFIATIIIATDGGVVVLGVAVAVSVGDVVAQLEELTLKVPEFAIVHQRGQQVEALGGGDGVGLLGGCAVNVFAHAPDVCPVGGVALVAVRVFDDGRRRCKW